VKTSDPKEQFLTGMKNCKFGVFRVGMGFREIEEVFGGICEIERPKEGGMAVYSDGFDIFFEDESLERINSVKAHFRDHESALICRKAASLSWLNWLGGQSFDEARQVLLEDNIAFRELQYTDDSYGILSSKDTSSLLILFDKSKVIQSVYNNFYYMEPYRILSSLKSYNL